VTRVAPDILRGRLSDDEKDRIAALAGRGLGPGQIARKLNRHPGTVNFHMHCQGLRTLARRSFAYTRKGRPVRSFSREEDAFLTDLRVAGVGLTEIAKRVSSRFGYPRGLHTIRVRLIFLANAEEA
jgi:hypothetical protein